MAEAQSARSPRMQLLMDHLRAEQSHDLDGIMATFGRSPRFVMNGIVIDGQDAIRGLYAGFGFANSGAFSDIQLETLHMHEATDSITVELMVHGRHTGEWQGISATQRQVEIPMCAVVTFDDQGRMAGERVYFDGALVLRQIGN